MVLNDSAAVRTFSQAGSVTLGGNVSIAAGPVGRNAEASGAASLRSVAGVFSYRYHLQMCILPVDQALISGEAKRRVYS